MTGQSHIRNLRRALAMSSEDLGRAVGKSGGTIRYLEKSEANGTVTLANLQQLAEAMGHEVVIQMIPKKSIESQLKERAAFKAKELVSRISKTMGLENQHLTGSQMESLEMMLVEKFLAKPKLLNK